MADKDFKNDGVPEITRNEHVRKNVGAKSVVIRGYLPGSDELVLITAVEHDDGTYSFSSVDPNKRDALPYAEILTSSATITPTSGKRIKLLKAQVLQSPANESYNVVTLNFSSLGDLVTGWAYSDSNEWIGNTNEALNITLANANPVSVNIRYKEIT
jgi:hypothetical protein